MFIYFGGFLSIVHRVIRKSLKGFRGYAVDEVQVRWPSDMSILEIRMR